MSAPRSPGGARTPREVGSKIWISAGARRVRGLGPGANVLQCAVHVRMLHHDRGDVRGERRGDPPGARGGVKHIDHVAPAGTVGAQGVDRTRVDSAGDQVAGTIAPAAHVRGLDQGRGAIVERRVRDLHPGQRADHRLELEERLQHTLRQLRLVGRVGRVELRTARQRPDDRRDVVVVGARPREADQIVGRSVLRRQPAHVGEDLLLGDTGWQIERIGEPESLRDLREEGIDGGHADRREHLADVVLGMGREVHAGQSTAARARVPSVNPMHLRARTWSPRTSSRAGRRPCIGSRDSAPEGVAPSGSSWSRASGSGS